MAFSRKIAYLYNYENNVKCSNLGFAKLEKRDGHRKLTVRATIRGKSGCRVFLYAIKCTESGIKRQLLGSITVINSVAEGCYEECGIDSTLLLSMDDGVMLESEGVCIAALWNGEDLCSYTMQACEQECEPKSECGCECECEPEPGCGCEGEPEPGPEPEPEPKPEPEPEPEPEPKPEPEPEPKPEPKPEPDLKPEPGPGAVSPLEYMFRCRERFYPFEDGELQDCVKAAPQDIGLLPMAAWGLVNNSFLLHGYYNNGYVLLARRNTRKGTSYLVMVPGSYSARDGALAERFGFFGMKGIKPRQPHDGEFVCWYKEIS